MTNPKVMLSTEIAALTKKRHDHVIRDIEIILKQLNEDSQNFGSGFKSITYLAGNGQQYKCYELDYEATMIVMTGYDVVARAKVIKRWQELEKVTKGEIQRFEMLKTICDNNTKQGYFMKHLFCVLCLIGATTVVYAENDFMIKVMEERFKNADQNSDHQITLEEAENGMPRVAAHFDVIDVNRNGYATVDEIKAAIDKL